MTPRQGSRLDAPGSSLFLQLLWNLRIITAATTAKEGSLRYASFSPLVLFSHFVASTPNPLLIKGKLLSVFLFSLCVFGKQSEVRET